MKAPNATELSSHPAVQAALDEAWEDSLPVMATLRHEEGGWIYMDMYSGELSIVRATGGAQTYINLNEPPSFDGSVIVGKFHTHPNPTIEGWHPGPSQSDRRIDEIHGVPDLILADNGLYYSGPDSRRGGLEGETGFPE